MARAVVVDTNVIACYLLRQEPQSTESRPLFRDEHELLAPGSWRAEMLSVVWQAQRRALCSVADGLELLEAAETLMGQTVPIQSLWREALVVAAENVVSPYDTLFVVLAEREGCPLVSFDAALRRKFPSVVRRPAELV